MAVGKRKNDPEPQEFWVATEDLPRVASHPCYQKLNEVSESADPDRKVEALAEPYYSKVKVGRKSLPPSVYVRMLLIGYFEGIDSERGIAWRCVASLAIREFLGYRLTERTPDHSTLSGTRRRIPVEWHEEVFALVSALLVEKGLIKGNTIALDASTMEANAAMRAIVRRDTKLTYDAFVKRLAVAPGKKEGGGTTDTSVPQEGRDEPASGDGELVPQLVPATGTSGQSESSDDTSVPVGGGGEPLSQGVAALRNASDCNGLELASPAGLEPATCGLGRSRPGGVSDGKDEDCGVADLRLGPQLVPETGTESQLKGKDGTPDLVVVDDPELARLIAAWPRLPVAVRRGILAMVDTIL